MTPIQRSSIAPKCAKSELVPPAVLPPPSVRATTANTLPLARTILLVRLWIARFHGHGQDPQRFVVHLRAEN